MLKTKDDSRKELKKTLTSKKKELSANKKSIISRKNEIDIRIKEIKYKHFVRKLTYVELQKLYNFSQTIFATFFFS